MTSPQKISLRRSISQRRASLPRHCIWASVMISFQPFSGSQKTSGRVFSRRLSLVHSRRISAIRAEAAIAATRSARARSTARSAAVMARSSRVSPVKIFPAAVCSRPVEWPLP